MVKLQLCANLRVTIGMRFRKDKRESVLGVVRILCAMGGEGFFWEWELIVVSLVSNKAAMAAPVASLVYGDDQGACDRELAWIFR